MAINESIISYGNIQKLAIRKVKDMKSILYLDIQRRSPVKTGKYISSHRDLGVRFEGTQIIGEIQSEMDYSERVERGFRKSPVNWHLKDGTIYRAVGANPYKLAVASLSGKLDKLGL